jgi:hypothetical protein
MGSMLEINDTLEITTEQGFPERLFSLKRHRKNPISLDTVKDKVFKFKRKVGPRFFHLDPVRVFWIHNINGKWLAWGHIVILEQRITRDPDRPHQGAVNVSDPEEWLTSGKYKIVQIYDPAYQEAFTRNDLPASLSYFQQDSD